MISPTIKFPGNCIEAINFYENVFDSTDKQVDFFRNAPSNPGFPVTEDNKDLVMHASMTICGTVFNFSDSQEKTIAGNMICFNVFLQSPDEVCNAFKKLKDGGSVIVDLGPQFFSKMYCSVVDQFGIKWQLIS